jgi:hypothetical protein
MSKPTSGKTRVVTLLASLILGVGGCGGGCAGVVHGVVNDGSFWGVVGCGVVCGIGVAALMVNYGLTEVFKKEDGEPT